MIRSNSLKGILLCLIAGLFGCQGASDAVVLEEKDLLSYGIPITIQAPVDADIKTMDWGFQRDITVSDSNWYKLQIFSSRATIHNLADLKAQYVQEAVNNPYFREITQEDPDGFVFSLEIDSLINYDFRHFKLQGDNEYLFQAGMIGSFTEEQIQRLYQIAKEAR